jgi:hypothetical protein
VVGDQRSRDLGVDVSRSARRVRCVSAVDDRLVEDAGHPELRPGALVPGGVPDRRVEGVVGARARDPLRRCREPRRPLVGVRWQHGHLRGQLRGVGDALLDDRGDPVLGLADVLDEVPDGPLGGGRDGGVRSRCSGGLGQPSGVLDDRSPGVVGTQLGHWLVLRRRFDLL